MIGIVAGHFICHGFFPEGYPIFSEANPVEKIIICLNIFVCFGTNLFVIISGYYGIRLSWKSLINLWILTTFYSLMYILVNGPITISSVLHSFIISSTKQWFFRSYFWLLLMSPLINAGINALNNKGLTYSTLLCFILCCISGWYLENENIVGHNFHQLLFAYILGAFIKRNSFKQKITSKQAIWGFTVTCTLGLVFLFLYQKRGTFMHLTHNSPFVVASAFFSMIFFLRLSFNSKVINYAAKSVPAVLLLSDMVFSKQLYTYINLKLSTCGFSISLLGILAILLVSVFLVSFAIDQLRILVSHLLANRLYSTLDKITLNLSKTWNLE